jgi:hypothetical protein
MKKPEEVQRVFIGIYLSTQGCPPHTFSYAERVFQVTYGDGTQRVEHEKPVYEDDADSGREWWLLWPALKAMWCVAERLLGEIAERRAKKGKRRVQP